MPAFAASSEVLGRSIAKHSQIANVDASADYRNRWNDESSLISHNANMDDSEEKNGGPNHLSAWMRYRKVKGAELAKLVETTPGVISDLVNSNRQLNAKWLRRIAPALKTTPGMLLDHDPFSLDSDILEIWIEASFDQKRTISDLAKVIVGDGKKNGTNGA